MEQNHLSKKLYEKGFINFLQYDRVKSYRAQGLFSIRNEILFLIFTAVLLFSSGAGIFIYKNIGNLGHILILLLILVVTIASYYYGFKHSPGFTRKKSAPEKPLYSYLVLAASMLGAVFIAYLQLQYGVFGYRGDLATLLPTALFFLSAYYFDHKGVLTLGISGLCAFIGFSTSPMGLLHNNFGEDSTVATYAIILSIGLVGFTFYAKRNDLKVHFNGIYESFALHIMGVACLSRLFGDMWMIPLLALAAGLYYFIWLAYRKNSMNYMAFSLIYAFLGLTFVYINLAIATEMGEGAIYFAPLYFIGCILLFIKFIRQFRARKHFESN